MGCASSAVVAVPPQPNVDSSSRHEFFNEYSLGEMIGKGSYAQVHVASQKCSESSTFAVKIQRLRSKSSDKLRKSACGRASSEISLWNRVGSHRNCVELREHFFDKDLCYMVMEKCRYGLIPYIKNFTAVTEESLAGVFTQMLQGIAHMHSVRVAHRDIKPENFLVGGCDAQTVKICDFGLAAFVPEGGTAVGVCGTAPYMCPEMLQHHEIDLKADVWSVGVVAHLLFCGEWPYKGVNSHTMKIAITRGRTICYDKMTWLTPTAKLFLLSLLTRDPRVRPNATTSLGARFLTGNHKAKRSLAGVLSAAGALIAFHAPHLDDELSLDDLNARSTTRTLAQNEMNLLARAAGKGLEKSLEDHSPPDCGGLEKAIGNHSPLDCGGLKKATGDHSPPDCSDSDCEKDGMSFKSESTNVPSSGVKSISCDMDMWASPRFGL